MDVSDLNPEWSVALYGLSWEPFNRRANVKAEITRLKQRYTADAAQDHTSTSRGYQDTSSQGQGPSQWPHKENAPWHCTLGILGVSGKGPVWGRGGRNKPKDHTQHHVLCQILPTREDTKHSRAQESTAETRDEGVSFTSSRFKSGLALKRSLSLLLIQSLQRAQSARTRAPLSV